MVVLVEGHFQIESDEFSKMSVGVAVLGSEDVSNHHDLLKASGDQALLVELWGLCEVALLLEVLHLKYGRTTFGGSSEHFRYVDIEEATLLKIFSKQFLDTCSDLED